MHFQFLSHEPKLPSYLQQQLFNTQFAAHVSVVQHSIEGGRTLGQTYGIEARCYWEHPWGTHWEYWEHSGNLKGTLWEQGNVHTHLTNFQSK